MRLARGFTLIELLVVVGIMVIITGTLLIRQQQFNSSTLLRSLAYSVALSIRQAQTYGISVLGTSGTFTAQAYGIHFTGSCSQVTSYLLFADTANKGYYDGSATVIRTFTLNKGYYISNFATQEKGSTQYDCACGATTIKLGKDSNGVMQTAVCASSGYDGLDIMFRRPNPDACFAVSAAGGYPNGVCDGSASQSNYPLGFIQVNSQGGGSRGIRINTTGEIEVVAGT